MVLIACEESQRVCSAFRALDIEAYSCDIKPCGGGHPEWHIHSDVLSVLDGNCSFTTQDNIQHSVDEWQLIIAHPPCTYIECRRETSIPSRRVEHRPIRKRFRSS